MLGGVAGGLGAFYDINPLWFRIAFLLLMIPGGIPGPLVYLVLWIIIPKK